MKDDFLDLTELVRSLQRAEENPDCFRRDLDSCDTPDCPWRSLCLEQPEEPENL